MTVDEMQETLTRLGLSVSDTRGDEIQINCPAHKERTGKEDNNPSLWINADSGAFICFSCQWKGNLYTLVERVGGIAPGQAESWVKTDLGLRARFQRLMDHKDAKRQEEPAIIHESMLSAFVPVPPIACKGRGLLPEMTQKYGVLWNANDESWIIPIRDPLTSKLLGWQEKGANRRFFKNTTRVKKSDALFGYEQFEGGTMVVVESPLDVVRLASVGVQGAVAAYGCIVSTVQFSLIRGANKVIFAMDNDKAGLEASRDLLKRAKEVGLDCSFFNYAETDQKDVGGMSKAEIVWGIDNAIHMLRKRG